MQRRSCASRQQTAVSWTPSCMILLTSPTALTLPTALLLPRLASPRQRKRQREVGRVLTISILGTLSTPGTPRKASTVALTLTALVQVT